MVSLIWKYYSVPVAVVPSKWITPLDRLVAFPTRVAGERVLASVVGERGGSILTILKNSQASSKLEAVNSTWLSICQRHVRPISEMKWRPSLFLGSLRGLRHPFIL